VPEVRVIGADGSQIGIIPTHEALKLAEEQWLELVEVNPRAMPPVCKVMDFGKFKYSQKKRASKQKQHQVQVKEIRVRPKTGDHDIEVKVKRAREFLEAKDKVLVNVLFRGRELAHIDEGRRVMEEVLQALEEFGKVEKTPSMEGRRMTAILAPRA
jgi:translation initiation factor IF-3